MWSETLVLKISHRPTKSGLALVVLVLVSAGNIGKWQNRLAILCKSVILTIQYYSYYQQVRVQDLFEVQHEMEVKHDLVHQQLLLSDLPLNVLFIYWTPCPQQVPLMMIRPVTLTAQSRPVTLTAQSEGCKSSVWLVQGCEWHWCSIFEPPIVRYFFSLVSPHTHSGLIHLGHAQGAAS